MFFLGRGLLICEFKIIYWDIAFFEADHFNETRLRQLKKLRAGIWLG
jgi:hypothetical protein